MHRHGYQGTKFHRERDQREALIQSLAEALIIHESIETTLPKAKAVVPYVEKLITKAKKGDLHNRRQVIASLQTVSTAHKLVEAIAERRPCETSMGNHARFGHSRRFDSKLRPIGVLGRLLSTFCQGLSSLIVFFMVPGRFDCDGS